MKNLIRSPMLALIGAVVLYCVYLLAGYLTVRNLPSNVLIDLALYPSDISAEWRLVPFIDRLSISALEGRGRAEIEADFVGLGYTLYSGALGYRDVSSDPHKSRPSGEEARARALTEMLFRKGVGVAGSVDPQGCSAVHQAVLGGDAESAKFLLGLAGVSNIPGNPDAKYEPCRRDASTLAAARGIALQ